MSDSKEWIMMKETDLVFFKCPGCDEMVKLREIRSYREQIKLRWVVTKCPVCAEKIRLRFKTE